MFSNEKSPFYKNGEDNPMVSEKACSFLLFTSYFTGSSKISKIRGKQSLTDSGALEILTV